MVACVSNNRHWTRAVADLANDKTSRKWKRIIRVVQNQIVQTKSLLQAGLVPSPTKSRDAGRLVIMHFTMPLIITSILLSTTFALPMQSSSTWQPPEGYQPLYSKRPVKSGWDTRYDVQGRAGRQQSSRLPIIYLSRDLQELSEGTKLILGEDSNWYVRDPKKDLPTVRSIGKHDGPRDLVQMSVKSHATYDPQTSIVLENKVWLVDLPGEPGGHQSPRPSTPRKASLSPVPPTPPGQASPSLPLTPPRNNSPLPASLEKSKLPDHSKAAPLKLTISGSKAQEKLPSFKDITGRGPVSLTELPARHPSAQPPKDWLPIDPFKF
jgi:hypothetical protein